MVSHDAERRQECKKTCGASHASLIPVFMNGVSRSHLNDTQALCKQVLPFPFRLLSYLAQCLIPICRFNTDGVFFSLDFEGQMQI